MLQQFVEVKGEDFPVRVGLVQNDAVAVQIQFVVAVEEMHKLAASHIPRRQLFLVAPCPQMVLFDFCQYPLHGSLMNTDKFLPALIGFCQGEAY